MYKKQFEIFDKEDSERFSDEGINLFVGSSSIRRWETITEDMSPKKVLNRGFGGSTMEQLILFHERLILRYKFKKIFIYEGDNDIGKKRNKIDIVLQQFKKLEKIIHTHQPDAQINFLSIKCSPYKKGNCKTYKIANKIFEEYCQSENYLNFIDISFGFLDENNNIKSKFFNETDGIHPSLEGYKYLTKLLKPYLYPQDF
ncbi:MAG: hypothetical protein JXL97_13875 [Bacteroidales bacterium]|nr:hypothetical protein [Bacteroidales bacterium]